MADKGADKGQTDGQIEYYQDGVLTLKRGEISLASFAVEVADDEKSRATGLMYRQSLAPDQAMLFIYDRARLVRMWMKNTYVPLDMLFADDYGRITRIHTGAIPQDLTVIDGGDAVRYVLEVVAGTVRDKGLKVGDVMVYPSIKNLK